MKTFFTALLMIVSLVTKAQNVKKLSTQKLSSQSLIGIVYNDEKKIKEFKGYKYMGGTLLNYKSAVHQKVEYALSQMYKTGKLILILSKTNEDTTKGKWTLLNTVLVKQNIYEGGKYILVTEGCTVNSRSDDQVFAILPYNPNKKFFKNPVRAFKVDKINDRIIELKNRSGIYCINDTYGEDTN